MVNFMLHGFIFTTIRKEKKKKLRDFPGGPVAKTPCS